MDLIDAVNTRRSVRGFLDTPVARETLEAVLTHAMRSISRVNAQPWQFAVVSGSVLRKLAEDNLARHNAGEPQDRDYGTLPELYYRRRIDTAKRLLSAMQIPREDTAGKEWWSQRGLRYFNAPAAIILYMDEGLNEATFRFDMGCVAQTICLAAMEYGLGTCVADQIIFYQKGLRTYLDLPESARFVTGIAIGYPDPDFPANAVVMPREDISTCTRWYGFDE